MVDVPFKINVLIPAPVAVNALENTNAPVPFVVIVPPAVVPAKSITLSVV